MGANKDKGTRAESAVVRLAREMYWPYAERRALTGGKDRGDITGIPGVVIQVKDVERQSVGAWQEATLTQMVHDGANTCILVVKRKYKNPRQWDAYIPMYQLLYEAGDMADAFGGNIEDGLPWARVDLEVALRWLKEAGY